MAVPAPKHGTDKYPDEYSLLILSKFGVGLDENSTPFTSLGSKNDSSCTNIILGVLTDTSSDVSKSVSSKSCFKLSMYSCEYSLDLLMPLSFILLVKQYATP